jgi:hypothetical protein
MNIDGRTVTYVIYKNDPSILSIYNDIEDKKLWATDIEISPFCEFDIGIICKNGIYGPIRGVIDTSRCIRCYYERILDIKMN